MQLRRPEAAAEHVARAEQLCRDRADRAKLSAVIGTRAGLCFQLGRYLEALEAYKEGYDLALEFENRSGEASSALGMAQTLKELKRPKEALDWFTTARRLFQITGEAFWEFQALKHIVDLSEASAPEEAYVRALKDAVALGLSVKASAGQLVPLLAKQTQLNDRQGRTAEATRDFDNALELVREAGNRQLESALLSNRGAHLADAGLYPEAMTWLDKALRLAVEIGDAEGAEIAATNLDRLYSKLAARRMAGHETPMPATAADKNEAALAADRAGSEAPKGSSGDDRPTESDSFDAMPKAIERVVLAFLREPPEGIDHKTWAERLGKVSAAFARRPAGRGPSARDAGSRRRPDATAHPQRDT